MPPRRIRVGRLSDEDTVDLVAFILERNGYPAGSRPLKPGSGLAQIEVVRMPGRTLKPPANFAFVQTVGCVTHGPGTSWSLKGANDPVLTRDEPATAATLKNAAATSPGPHTFVLLSVGSLKLESYEGRKVEAKGLVYRSPDENLLDVTSLQAVASGCQTNECNFISAAESPLLSRAKERRPGSRVPLIAVDRSLNDGMPSDERMPPITMASN